MDYALRRVHLDFHTSELIGNVGCDFDGNEFARTFKEANVESVTVFAKCHHGYSYYDTKVGVKHPSLNFNLLDEQIKVLHENGIQAPIYYPIGWSDNDVMLFKESIYKDKSGNVVMINGGKPFENSDESKPEASWITLCPSGKYKEMIFSQIEEICKRYEKIYGFFFDIVFLTGECYCENCLKKMQDEKVDINNMIQVSKFGENKLKNFICELNGLIKSFHKDATIYYNSAAHYNLKPYHYGQTHYEIEDLPSVWGGYNKLALESSYLKQYNKPYIGMTGKFHTAWGEFGGNKSYESLKIEIAQMLTYGAGTSIGDQLHPCGKLDKTTYDIIGKVFEYSKSISDYCIGGETITKIAQIVSYDYITDMGISKILLDSQIDADVIDITNDWGKYDCIILPSSLKVDEKTIKKIKQYIGCGKKIVAMGKSLVDDGRFYVDVGGEYIGSSNFDIDYAKSYLNLYSQSPILMYRSGELCKLTSGQSLGEIYNPYFSRTYKHFCSHANTPYDNTKTEFVCGIKKNNIIWLSHNLGELYYNKGAQLHRLMLQKAIDLVYTPIVKTSLKTGGRVRLIKLNKKNCYVLNALYFNSAKRGMVEIVEDLLTLNVDFEINIQEKIRKIVLLQNNEIINFDQIDNKIVFSSKIIEGHSTFVLEY